LGGNITPALTDVSVTPLGSVINYTIVAFSPPSFFGPPGFFIPPGFFGPPGFFDPCAGYVCQPVNPSTGCYKYDFFDCATVLPECVVGGNNFGAYYHAYGDCNCNCPASFAAFQYCYGFDACP